MTSLKNLEKSITLYNEIKQLDNDIIDLEKRAMDLADKDQGVVIDLCFQSNQKPETPKDSYGDDLHMGFVPFGTLTQMLMGQSGDPFKQLPFNQMTKKAEFIKNTFTLNSTETLCVLGVIVGYKKEKRRSLIKQLIDLGFKM